MNALNTAFKNQTGKETRSIILVDEYDWPHRQKECPAELIENLQNVFGLAKEPSSGVSLFFMAGLTRMVGTGISQLNTRIDVAFFAKYHGLCGIQMCELLASVGNQLDKLSKLVSGYQTLDEYLDKELVNRWNGFRFAVDTFETKQLQPLFSPVDVWQLVSALQNKQSPSSEWIKQIHSEFEFVQFNECNWTDHHRVVEDLMGGWVPIDEITKQRERTNYFNFVKNVEEGHSAMRKRVLYELGLLQVQQISVANEEIYLHPPNTEVYEQGLQKLIQNFNVPLPTTENIRKIFTTEGLADMMKQAAKRLTTTYAPYAESVREYPLQDFSTSV